MTEMEFFAQYEIKPYPGQHGIAVRICRRDGGHYGEIRTIHDANGTAFVVTVPQGGRVGSRKSFGAALKLLIRHLPRA